MKMTADASSCCRLKKKAITPFTVASTNKIDDLAVEALEYLENEGATFLTHTIDFTYDYWTHDEIIHAALPEELCDGSPTGFATTGHIAHLNLNDEYLPYKYIIGQIIMDKNLRIRTVVNKLNNIHEQFRFFEMELVAGEPDFVVEHLETDCRFTFDFREVYWNSRLHTEHERLVSQFEPQDGIVADVMAGVGPFAVPAAKKGCAVFANDLNPNCEKWLRKNVTDNHVSVNLRVFCEDGRDFIRASFKRAHGEPFPPYAGKKLSKRQEKEERKRRQDVAPERTNSSGPDIALSDKPIRNRIAHFVMNLPDTAIEFLDAFRGVFKTAERELSGLYEMMPVVHCHCFTRYLDAVDAKVDIRKRVEKALGGELEDATVHFVRLCTVNASPYFIASIMLPFPLPRVLSPISCDDGLEPSPATMSRALGAISSFKKVIQTPESELKRWRRTFDMNAKVTVGDAKFLDRNTFVDAIAPKSDLSKLGRVQFSILFKVADNSKRGLVSWDDFAVFQTILKRPDADYWIAFQYFDVDSSGTITFDEFKNVFSSSLSPDMLKALSVTGLNYIWAKEMELTFSAVRISLQACVDTFSHPHKIHSDNEFTQLMKGLQGERLRQAFKYLDDNQDGFIRPDQFKRIIMELAGHKLSDAVIERLPTLCTLTPGGKISYSEVIAFHNVIREMDMVERVIREATRKSKDGRIDQSDFLNHTASSTRYNLFTPMEASIIFHFAGRGDGNQRLALIDFAQLLDPRWKAPMEVNEDTKHVPATTTFLSGLAQSAYSFIQGGFAGAWGATIVYPIDLGNKDPNQRGNVVGELLYRNSLDCVQKVLRNEGFLGFYRGLGPQLIGVAPEKAIKLVVNDLIRGMATDSETGRIKLGWEFVAGATAGGCQVVFTNPLEIVKIRLQVAGEAAKAEGAVPRGAIHIVRQLGLVGLYKGASACLLRDIPFSAIYFTAYNHMKKDLYQEGYNGKKLSFMETLISAGVAGMPAAYLTTPADVVKTRLQVEARKGQTHYKGLADAFVKIYREEGFKALFKGGPARVLRSSPQFGFTLVAYEYLHKFPWEDRPKEVETALTSGPENLAKVRARNALKILLDVHGNVGGRAASS
ncbi:hypothetical protein EW145_g2768 [Phellinidium pouzarii]|uniref:tRNA (guanine(37)-N1)-methyltransferase n=1 Tax=Phellinidium pouzarii TaxID=167371 RepID=A0A4S4L9K4_9AGAM|nr:hypothetical protein EW145_g2768 [Phellinidium pouzarii]